jgi:hypothetical protein
VDVGSRYNCPEEDDEERRGRTTWTSFVGCDDEESAAVTWN